MSYRVSGLGASMPLLQVAGKPATAASLAKSAAPLAQLAGARVGDPWGKTMPRIGISYATGKTGFPPLRAPASWDAQGKITGQNYTDIRPTHATFGKLLMPESDFTSASSWGVSGDPRHFDCIDYGPRHVDPNTMTDAWYSASAGINALLYFKEERIRRLFYQLLNPIFGFKTGLSALAYDASLHKKVSVAPGLLRAIQQAKTKFDKDFPRSRWVLGEYKITCDKATLENQFYDPRSAFLQNAATVSGSAIAALLSSGPLAALVAMHHVVRRPSVGKVNGKCPRGFADKSDQNLFVKAAHLGSGDCLLPHKFTHRLKRWLDPQNAYKQKTTYPAAGPVMLDWPLPQKLNCVGFAVYSAPSVQGQAGGLVNMTYGPQSRRIPVWAAVQVVGDEILPTPWFENFLDCINGKSWRRYDLRKFAGILAKKKK